MTFPQDEGGLGLQVFGMLQVSAIINMDRQRDFVPVDEGKVVRNQSLDQIQARHNDSPVWKGGSLQMRVLQR